MSGPVSASNTRADRALDTVIDSPPMTGSWRRMSTSAARSARCAPRRA
ncbi:hypothetical protein [Streptomyces sp. NPDC048277]